MATIVRGGLLGVVLAGVLLAASGPAGRAAPAAQGARPKCEVKGNKTASPAKIRLGETVQIRLELTPECPPASFRAVDVVLVIDRSRSMQGTKDTQARRAASEFVDTILASPIQRVGLVTFDGSAYLGSGLSQNAAAVKAAINSYPLGSGTNIAAGLDMAFVDILQKEGRADALPVIVLMSDGAPNAPGNGDEPSTAAVRSANFARIAGVVIYGIGIGSDTDANLMKQIVGNPANYYFSPDAEDLVVIYRAIALLVGDAALRDLTLDDDLYKDVALVDGTANPAPTIAGRRLTWTAALVPSTGLTWVYEVKPTKVGTYPTNDRAVAAYTDADEVPRTFVFPQPVIQVLDPEPSGACNSPKAWTIMVHSFPDAIGKSGGDFPGCNNQFDSGDWAEGTNNRLPPLHYKLTDVNGTKVLYEGMGAPGPGRVDQRHYIRVCQPPPYVLTLVTKDFAGYSLCPNSKAIRVITDRDFQLKSTPRNEERYGFVRVR